MFGRLEVLGLEVWAFGVDEDSAPTPRLPITYIKVILIYIPVRSAGGELLPKHPDFQAPYPLSDGIRQSARGESESVIFGPSGTQLRLYCAAKNRRQNVSRVRRMVAAS